MRRFTTFDICTLFVFCLTAFSSAAVNAQDRWNTTATDGSGLQLGDPTTVTWGFVADGTAISPAFSGESSNPSSLISFMENNVGSDWQDLFVDIFDRWDAVSGLTFAFEPNDSGEAINGSSTPLGQLGVVADVRIGGHSIDGQSGSNTLAYNYSPDHGDMVIDTDNVSFFSNSSNNYRGLRNVLAHEFGHGMGMPHVSANNSRQLMEAFVDTAFDGPQIDDIHQAQRRYGDDNEDLIGNDTFDLATDLGAFGGTLLEIGVDADFDSLNNSTFIAPSQEDFVSIDDNSDTDFLSITLDGTYDMSFVLDMVGPTYNRNGSNTYNLSTQSDLDLTLFADDGTTMLGESSIDGLNVNEQIDLQLEAGTYLARITGRNNAAQFYRFQAFGTAVPEPSSLLALGMLGTLLLRRKRS